MSNAEFRLVPERLRFFNFAFGLLFFLYWLAYLLPPAVTLPAAAKGWLAGLSGGGLLPWIEGAIARALQGMETLNQWVELDGGRDCPWRLFTSYGSEAPLLSTAANWWGILSLVALWLIIPAALHAFILRAKVLSSLRGPVPHAFADWFVGLPSEHVGVGLHGMSATRRALKLFGHLLWSQMFFIRMLPASRDPTVWQSTSSSSAGMLYLGMADYFSDSGDNWKEAGRSTIRFALTYCEPIWTSYIWLVLTITLFRTGGAGRTLLSFAWTGVALIFILTAIVRYHQKIQLTFRESLRALTFMPIWEAVGTPKDLALIRERWVRIAISSLPAIGLGLALTAIQDLPPDESSLLKPTHCPKNSACSYCPEMKDK